MTCGLVTAKDTGGTFTVIGRRVWRQLVNDTRSIRGVARFRAIQTPVPRLGQSRVCEPIDNEERMQDRQHAVRREAVQDALRSIWLDRAHTVGRAVEIAILPDDQRRRLRALRCAEGMKRGESAVERHLENGAPTEWASRTRPASRGHTVEVAVRRLDQRVHGIIAVGEVKTVQDRHRAIWCHPENRASGEIPACLADAVEIAVRRLDESRGSSEFAAEGVQHGQSAVRRHPEDRAGDISVDGGGRHRAVEITVAALDQPRGGGHPVERLEAVERGCRTVGRHAEDRTVAVCSAARGQPVEIAVGGLDDRRRRRTGAARKLIQERDRAVGGHPVDRTAT